MRDLRLTVCLSVVLSPAAARAQAISSDVNGDAQAATSSSPVAYVYVASTPKNSSSNEIVAYAAVANGSLSPVHGSPFLEDVSSMAVNGKYLMASSRSTTNIEAFKIQSDGALTYAASTDYSEFNNPPYDCGAAGQIFFDHTGSTLYIREFNGSNACTNTVVASFNVVKASGALTYLGLANTGAFPGDNSAAYFIGNNVYAYTAVNSACMYYSFYGFKRSSSGLLSLFNLQANQPPPPSGVRGYVPALAAADPTNHLAFTMQPANPPGCAPGPLQLASYTADSSGENNQHSLQYAGDLDLEPL